MAQIFEPSQRQMDVWRKWIAERPKHVRAVAERFFPWELYRLKNTGHRVHVLSFQDDAGTVTLTVAVTGQFNKIHHERAVFGINPDDLEPCELPSPDEELGAELSQQEVEDNIDGASCQSSP